MNIFHVPSWYPSESNPIYGTFVQEQISMLAKETPEWSHGISLWGQGNPDDMLWAKDHLLNIKKILQRRPYFSDQIENLHHYNQPTLTWSRKVLNGNLRGLYKTNEEHLKFFAQTVGEINIIHAQATYPAALIANYLSEKFGIPYVITIRMSPFPFAEFLTNKGDLKPWIRQPLERAKGLIATSTSLKNRLQQYDLKKITVIHNPVDIDFFKPISNQPETLNILTVGRMVSQKGIDILLEAIRTLGPTFSGHFRIGGDGPELKKYKTRATELGIDSKITWLGELSRDEVRSEMQKCSFYVLPSRHETFGNVLLEAMACGKPGVATKCGGPEDIVKDESGTLCENESPCDLAAKLEQMAINLQSYSAEKIRKIVLDEFSSKVFRQSIEQFLTK